MAGFHLFVLVVMGATCGAGNAHFSGTPDFTSFEEFMISPINYISVYTLHNLSVLGLCLWINDWFVCLYSSDCFVSDLFISYRR